MDKLIQINVTDRRAQALAAPVIICGNSGIQVQFVLDDEWANLNPKTARFAYVRDGKVGHQDIVFEGDTAEVPVLSNIREVRVGVFAGDLVTTTPAVIPCEPSILCGSGEPEVPSPSVYDQIMALFRVRVLDPYNTIDYLVDQRNLFEGAELYADENGATTPYTINSAGEIVTNTPYPNSAIYGPIGVKPNTVYTSLAGFYALAEYDAGGAFLRLNWTTTKVGSAYQFTTSADCVSIKAVCYLVSQGSAQAYTFYLFEGGYSARPPYQGHTHVDDVLVCEENLDLYAVAGDKVQKEAIKEEHCDFIKTNKDFLKAAGVTWGVGVCNRQGVFDYTQEVWRYSSFVPVYPSTEYRLGFYSNVSVMGFDRYQVPCSSNTSAGLPCTNGVFTTPADCYYLVINTLPANVEKMTLFYATADQTQPDTFSMEGLKVGMNNLGSDVLGAVKAPTSSILADLILTTEAKNIVLIGDSITHGMGSSDFAQSTDPDDFLFNAGSFPQYRNYGVKCWGGMLKTYLEDKFNCSVTNNGASGATSQQLVDNWDAIVSADDDVIICMIGTNDRGRTLSNTYQNIVAIYERAQANGQRVIFMAAPPTSVENEAQFTVCHMEDIDNLYSYANNALNVGYVSIYKEFLNYCRDTGTEVDTLLADGIHPNDTGYRLMFEIVLEALGFGRKRDGATW